MTSAPPGPLSRCEVEAHGDQAEGGQKQRKVEQTRVRVVQSQDDTAGQRREEVGKLQEDRSKAVIAKAIADRSRGESKCRGSEYTAEVRESSDGKLPSRTNSPMEQLEKSIEAMLSTPQRRTSHRGSESEHVARHHAG